MASKRVPSTSKLDLEHLIVARKQPRDGSVRQDDLAGWGIELPQELLTFAKKFDEGAFDDLELDELRPFYFEELLFVEGEGPFDPYLVQAQDFGWPVYFLAHFAGLHPIGATDGGDYWLAHVLDAGGGRSRVYHYDHETGDLELRHESIAALVQASLRFGASKERPKRDKLSASEDPLAQWERASFLASALGANGLESASEIVSKAGSLAAWKKERARFEARPDLAAYWLLHHLLLGNESELGDAMTLTASSRCAFVLALRSLAERFVMGAPLGKLDGPTVSARLERLRADAPTGAIAKRKTAARGVGIKKALASASSTEEVWALARTPQVLADVAAQVAILRHVGESEPSVRALVPLAENVLGPKRPDPKKTRALFEALARDRDPRLAPFLVSLLRRSMSIEDELDGRALSYSQLFAVLRELTDIPWVREELCEAAVTGKVGLLRLRALYDATRCLEDARIDARLERNITRVLDPSFKADSASPMVELLQTLFEVWNERCGASPEGQRLIVRALERELPRDVVAVLCRVARERHIAEAEAPLRAMLDVEDKNLHAAYALGAIAPAEARTVLAQRWEALEAKGQSWATPKGYYDRYHFACLLPGLLLATDGASPYREASAALLASTSELFGARAILEDLARGRVDPR